MSQIFKLLSLIVMSLLWAVIASAEPGPMAAPLETIVTLSDFIIIGKIIKVEKDPAWQFNLSKSGSPISPSGDIYSSVPSRYNFKVLYAIKGMPAAQIAVTLPSINARVYNGAKPNISVGSTILLFLKKLHAVSGFTLLPTDPVLPLAVLDNSDSRHHLSDLKNLDKSSSALRQVITALLNSMSDKVLLEANTYILKDVVNPMIPKRLMPFIDDPNANTQSNVLACLASNQVVETIPRIAHLHAKMLIEKGGGGCVDKLEDFKVKEAVPFLNPLLFSPYDAVRFCASMALRKVADATSIPYLIAGLADPDSTNQYECYATLTRLLPNLGVQKTIPDFDKNPRGICLPYLNWWREELDGHHLPRH